MNARPTASAAGRPTDRSRDGDGMDDTEKIKEPNQSIRMEQKIPDRRVREGCPDVLAHGSAPVTADCGEGIEGHTERAGLEVCLTYWAVSHAAQPYPIQVSEPIRI